MKRRKMTVIVLTFLCAFCVHANAFAGNVPKYHDIPAYQQKDFYETERVKVAGIRVEEVVGNEVQPLEKAIEFEIFNSTTQKTECEVAAKNGKLPELNLLMNHNYIIFAKDTEYSMENVYIWVKNGKPVDIKQIGDINAPTYDYPEVKSLKLVKRSSAVTDPAEDKRVTVNLPVRSGEASIFNVKIRLISEYETLELTSGNKGKIVSSLIEDVPYFVEVEHAQYGIESFPIVVKDKSEYGAGKYTYDFSSCARVEEIQLVAKDKADDKHTTVTSLSENMTVSGMNFKDFLLMDKKLNYDLDHVIADKAYEVRDVLLLNPHRWEVARLAAGNYTIEFSENKNKPVTNIYLLKGNDELEAIGFSRKDQKISFTMNTISMYPVVIEYEGFELKAPETAYAELSGGHDDVKFSWTESEGADGYLVSYKKATSKTWSKAVAVTDTSYKKKNLTDNVKYNFKVTPYILVDGKKVYDEMKNVIADVDTKKYVKAPSTLKGYLSGGYHNVKLSWSKSANASGYFVYMKSADEEFYTNLGSTTKRSYTVKNLNDGMKYTFKVVPYYKKNGEKVESYYSKTKTAYTLKKLDAPTVEKYSSKKVRVKWENISGETGYQISRSSKEDGTYIVSTYSTTSGKSKTVTATKGKTYYYKVRVYKTVNGKRIYAPWSDVTTFVNE